MIDNKPLPNFTFAGAPKSASSTLFEYIKQHPNIYMCPIKEPFFFDFNYEKGLDWYQSLFKAYQGEKIVGEATVWYMRWKPVPQRIYETIPNTKFLFVLRNPIDRAFSNYQMDLLSGKYTPEQTFSYVIRNEHRDSTVDRTIVSSGFYHQHLMNFEKYFDRQNFLIVLYDDLKNDIINVSKRVFNFLEVDPNFELEQVANKMIGSYANQEQLIKYYCRLPLFNYLWKCSRHFREIFIHRNFNLAKDKKPKMSSEDRQYLTQLYAVHNQALSQHLNTDLSHWK